MKIRLVVVGKLKEPFLKDMCNEYIKRLQAYASVEVVEVNDELPQANSSLKDEENCRIKEGERLLSKIKDNEYVYLLDLHGQQYDSVTFAKNMDRVMTSGKSTLTFVIGGSNGLSKEVLSKANLILSFGKITFPHQLFRVVLVEQIYRALTIIEGLPYHK